MELTGSHDPDGVMITICDADSNFPAHHLEQVEASYLQEPSDDVVYAWGNYSLELGLAHRIEHKVALLLRNGLPVMPVYSMISNDLVTSFCERYFVAAFSASTFCAAS